MSLFCGLHTCRLTAMPPMRTEHRDRTERYKLQTRPQSRLNRRPSRARLLALCIRRFKELARVCVNLTFAFSDNACVSECASACASVSAYRSLRCRLAVHCSHTHTIIRMYTYIYYTKVVSGLRMPPHKPVVVQSMSVCVCGCVSPY